ncbi:MAG: AAA family ATPase [Myxococcota bacterium]
MRVTVPVYQRRVDGVLEWTTLGLGSHIRTRRGRNAIKLQRVMADELKKIIERGEEDVRLADFEMSRGLRLARVSLELNLRSEDGQRTRAGGIFPLVLEPRGFSDETRGVIAYHPRDSGHWFVVRSEIDLESQAKRALEHAWANYAAVGVEEFRSHGRDLLRSFTFTARAPTLLTELPSNEKQPFGDLDVDPRKQRDRSRKKKGKRGGYPELQRVGASLTAQAVDNSLEAGRPRSPYREQLQGLLTGARKTPTVLLGPPGVGKRTLLRRWVMDLLEFDDFFTHRSLDEVHDVFALNGDRILAGMSYVGEWEKRVSTILNEVRHRRVVLWVDDLYAWGRIGQSRDSDRCLADLFRGPLQRGEVVLCGTSTPGRWERLREEAPSFADIFTTIRVEPASFSDTLPMMLHAARIAERDGAPPITPFALRSVLELGSALFRTTALPGAALDLMRKLARAASSESAPEIDTPRVIALLSQQTGLPEVLLRPDATLGEDEVKAALERRVIGQEAAVEAAVDLVMRVRAGLTERSRPYATYLLTGPTGTGKTELAKALSEYLYGATERLLRFDMGEFAGPDAVARLIGDRWNPAGLLTDAVRKQPFSVVLLDEIEKAHPGVLYLLLQLLDEGRLTDAEGARCDFTQTVIVMTSNLGASRRDSVGFAGEAQRAELAAADVKRAVQEFFPPELFNRIDRVVPFAPLTRPVAEQIARKELSGLLARRGLFDRNIFVFAEESAVRHIVDRAFRPEDGARSVKRYLEANLTTELAETLVAHPPAAMQILRVFAADARFRVHREALDEMPARVDRVALDRASQGGAAPDRASPDDAPTRPGETAGDPRDSKASDLVASAPVWEASAAELHRRAVALVPRVQTLVEHEERMRATDSTEWRSDDAESLYIFDRVRQEVRETAATLERLAGIGDSDVLEELEADEFREISVDPYTRQVARRRQFRRSELLSATPRLSREELLELVVNVQRWEALFDRVMDPDLHRTTLELLRVGRDRPASGRASERLFESMVRFYCGRRAELTEAAALSDDGTIATADDDIERLLRGRPRVVTIRLLGCGASDVFAEEEGCHVWSSQTDGSEVVRVRRCDPQIAARDQLEGFKRGEAAFKDALEKGVSALPKNPARLVAVRRRIACDIPARSGERWVADVEDYSLSHAVSRQVVGFEEILYANWIHGLAEAVS